MCLTLILFSRWFCHFDDDNYVNVPRLVKLLDEYSPSVDWYLGKPSISSPLEIHLDSVSANASYFCIFSYIVRNYKPDCDRLSPSSGPAQKPNRGRYLCYHQGHLSMPPFGFQLPAQAIINNRYDLARQKSNSNSYSNSNSSSSLYTSPSLSPNLNPFFSPIHLIYRELIP